VSVRVKVGPVSISSTGRVGVKAGPVYVAGGGRRRRPSSGSGNSGAGGALLLLLIAFVVAAVIVLYVVMWPLSLWGHAIHLTPSWHQLMHRNGEWMHQHYPLVGLRYLAAFALLAVLLASFLTPFAVKAREQAAERRGLAAEQQAERDRQALQLATERGERERERLAEQERHARRAHERWLAGPPPPLELPGRFTQTWIAHNTPALHPGQIPTLMDELKRRGWSDSDIERRVAPYLPAVPSAAKP
jgi:hypothetical protein